MMKSPSTAANESLPEKAAHVVRPACKRCLHRQPPQGFLALQFEHAYHAVLSAYGEGARCTSCETTTRTDEGRVVGAVPRPLTALGLERVGRWR